MKIIISILLSSIFFYGCSEKEKIEVIPNYEEIYLPIKDLDSTPILLEGDEGALAEKINKEISEKDAKENFRLDYSLYLDESGKVKKVEVISSPDKKYTTLAVKEFENWAFEPGKKNGKPVKSQYRWKFNLNNYYANNIEFNKSDYLVKAEEMPEPIGGIEAIQSKLLYPEIAKRAGIEGRVFVLTFINEEGNVISTEVIKGVGSGLDEAAVKAVRETKFTPAKINGKPVKVQVTVPIIFRLQ
jgi:TonB family protein